MTDGSYLTPQEYAARLGVTSATVVAWISGGELRALNLSRKGKRPRWRIRPEDAELFERGRANASVVAASSTARIRRPRPRLKYCHLR